MAKNIILMIERLGNVLYIRDELNVLRKLGEINDNERTLHTIRNKDKHLHRNTNSYGFNKELVDSGLIDYISINEYPTNDLYIVPIEDMHSMPAYKANDFEIQLMISLDKLKDYIVVY